MRLVRQVPRGPARGVLPIMMSARAFLAWLSFSVLLSAADQPTFRAAVSDLRALQAQSPSAEQAAAMWAKSLPSLVALLPTAPAGDLPGANQAFRDCPTREGVRAWQNYRESSYLSFVAFSVGDFLFGVGDFTKTVTGADFVTGAKLSPGERAFAMTFAVLSVVDPTVIAFAGKKVVSGTVRRVSGLRRGAAAAIPDGELKQAILRTTEGADDIAQSAQTARRGPDGVETKSAAGKADAVYVVADQAFDQARRFDIGARPRAVDRKLAAQPGSRGGDLRSGHADTGTRKLKTCPNPQEILGPTTAAGFVDGLGYISEIEQKLFIKGGEEAVRRLRSVACFTSETQVVMADGSRVSISAVKEGDFVQSRADGCPDRPTEIRKVISVQRNRSEIITQIQVRPYGASISGKQIKVSSTPTHPFWRIFSTKHKKLGWVLASELVAGDVLRGQERNYEVCSSGNARDEQIVYNLRIAGDHTYFVTQRNTEEAIWTHNECVFYNRFKSNIDQIISDNPDAKARLLAMLKKSPADDLSLDDFTSLWIIASKNRPASLPGFPFKKRETLDLKPLLTKIYSNSENGATLLNNVAHHIIPGELDGHDLAKIVGLIFDHQYNGIFLPGAVDGAVRSVHQGSHQAYTKAIKSEMDAILERSGMILNNPSTWTDTALAQARRDLRIIQARARRALMDNRLSLEVKFSNQPVNLNDLQDLWQMTLRGTLHE